jgi:hypothetical protein
MRAFAIFIWAYVLFIAVTFAFAQSPQDHLAGTHTLRPCTESPLPGKRSPDEDCAVLVEKRFNSTDLPAGIVFMRFENFATVQSAQRVATAASAVVEAGGKVWLLTLSHEGERSEGGQLVAEVGPVPAIPKAEQYVMDIAEADFGPEVKAAVAKAVHTHPGPEIFYLLTGEQCLETPAGAERAHAGEGMVAPAETPMQLNIIGSAKRDAFFIVIHDASKPRVAVSEWQPRGLCGE